MGGKTFFFTQTSIDSARKSVLLLKRASGGKRPICIHKCRNLQEGRRERKRVTEREREGGQVSESPVGRGGAAVVEEGVQVFCILRVFFPLH